MMTFPFPHWYLVATVLLLVPLSAHALSVYDVIRLSQKNYSDQDIVTLIQDTGSAFKLEAKDVVRLKELGLSESVIQVMLKTVYVDISAESETSVPDSPP